MLPYIMAGVLFALTWASILGLGFVVYKVLRARGEAIERGEETWDLGL